MARLPFFPTVPTPASSLTNPNRARKSQSGNLYAAILIQVSWPFADASLCWGKASMNVLIVEDSRFLRVSNERALQHAGYNVITAADGEEGLRLALERKPDLVILDLMLPKLPGYEVLRELRKRPETATMPVMIVSSLPQSNDQKLLDQGAT